MNSTPISVVIAGGGTAGHIEPALAVGEALRERHGARITALGTEKGLERDIIPARGVDLRLITPVPIPRKINAQLFKLPFNLSRAVREAKQVLKDVEADVVFGTGGYVAGPAYIAARSLGIPFYVLETNALAGIANKLGVKMGGIGLNAHPESGMSGEVVGIPVRASITGLDRAALREARELFEREYLLTQINRFGGNISRTASFVGMERSALHRKLKSLNVIASGRGIRREPAASAAVSAAMATVLPSAKPPRKTTFQTSEADSAAGNNSSTAAAPDRPWMRPMESTLQVDTFCVGPA